MEIHDLARDDVRWEQALPVLQELRTTLTPEELRDVLEPRRGQGPAFTAVFEDERCLAVAGWRVVVNTSAGRKLYVDDLVTARAARSRGVGAALLDALFERARADGCGSLELDSGVQRHEAHRFYLRERMDITAFHFSRRC